MSSAALLANHTPAVAADVWLRVADVIGIWGAARGTAEGRALERLFTGSRDLRTAGRAAIIRYSEADPIHVPSCMTGDAIAVPVALGTALDAGHCLRAIATGSAVGVRLARAIGGVAALALGTWPALFAAPAVAAVTDATARGLPAPLVETALLLALGGTSGRAGRPAGMPSGRWTTFGEATHHGLRAVRAAIAGARADETLISAAWLRSQTGDIADPAALSGDPRDSTFCIKTAVCARQALTAVEALRALAASQDLHRLDHIEVRLPTACLGVVSRPYIPGNRLSEVASLALSLGLVVHDPARLLNIGRDSAIPPQALDFARRVTIVAAPELDDAGDGIWSAVLRLGSAQRVQDYRLDMTPGDAGSPHRAAAVREKLGCLGAGEALTALARSSEEDADATLARFRAAFRS